MRRYIITGTPGAGKTVLIEELARRGYTTVPEAATAVIADMSAAGVEEHWLADDFVERIVNRQHADLVGATADVVLHDRSVICTLALCRHLVRDVPDLLIQELDEVMRGRVFQRNAFLVRPLGFVTPTAARRITYAQSLAFEVWHQRTYQEYGFRLIDVPRGTVTERADLVESVITAGWECGPRVRALTQGVPEPRRHGTDRCRQVRPWDAGRAADRGTTRERDRTPTAVRTGRNPWTPLGNLRVCSGRCTGVTDHDPNRPRLFLLGPVRLVMPDGTRPVLGARPLALLTGLALRAPHVVAVEQSISEVWDEETTSSSRNRLQVNISLLRRVLGAGAVITQSPGYSLNADAVATDLHEFELTAMSARHEQPDRAVDILSKALRLVSGEPLSGLPDGSLTTTFRSQLTERVVAVREQLISAQLAADDPGAALNGALALIADYPMRERPWCDRVLALYRMGRQADALESIRTIKSLLADDLGVDPGSELAALEEAVLRHDPCLIVSKRNPEALPRSKSADTEFRPSRTMELHAPIPLNTLVGRRTEMHDLLQLIEEPSTRLVTLTGPGGVGKTRIAQAIASSAADTLWFSLESFTDQADVIPALASACRVEGDRRSLIRSLGEVLSHRLLVLDNVEHVAGCAGDLVRLLEASSGLTLLVTSRVALRVPGEHLYSVTGLATDLDGVGAAELFVQRAVQAGASLATLQQCPGTIADIVRRVDGLPLAIELIAASARSSTVSLLWERLDWWISRETLRTATPARHRGLPSTIEWSWSSLSQTQQSTLARLAVLRSEFSVTIAAKILDVEQSEAICMLEAFVDRSLLQPGQDGAVRMLGVIRAYASSQLDARGLRHAANEAHALWVSDEFGRPRKQSDPSLGLDRAVVQNLDAALHWWTEQANLSAEALENAKRLLVLSSTYWFEQTSGVEYMAWFDRMWRYPMTGSRLDIQLVCLASTLAHRVPGGHTRAEWITRGLELCTLHQCEQWAVEGRVALRVQQADLAIDSGDYRLGRQVALDALVDARTLKLVDAEQALLNYLVDIVACQRDRTTALPRAWDHCGAVLSMRVIDAGSQRWVVGGGMVLR